jgi:hypothetical protein
MNSDFDIEVSTAWRLEPYLYVLAALCVIMNAEVNEERVRRTIARAIKLKVVAK